MFYALQIRLHIECLPYRTNYPQWTCEILNLIRMDKVKEKSAICKSLHSSIAKLQTTICYQEKILYHKDIPKKYKPSQLPSVIDPKDQHLLTDFETEYNTTFLSHLRKILNANRLTLEIKQEKLNKLILEIEQHLANTHALQLVSAQTIAEIYQNLMTSLNIQNSCPSPALKQILALSQDPQHNPDTTETTQQGTSNQNPASLCRIPQQAPDTTREQSTTPNNANSTPSISRKRKTAQTNANDRKKSPTTPKPFLGLGHAFQSQISWQSTTWVTSPSQKATRTYSQKVQRLHQHPKKQ